jgi:hypothetical protein
MAKGNPNPSPSTRFTPGSNGRGRQKGARDRLSAAFLAALADSFDEHGAAAIEEVRTKDPSTYVRVVASLLPKEVEVSRPLDKWSEAELADMIEKLEALLETPPEAEPAPKQTH